MGKFYVAGEKKLRPDVYQRYTNVGGVELAGAINGIVATVVKSSWGPLRKVITLENQAEADKILGIGGTTDVIREIFKGGAIKVYAVRLGSTGSKSTSKLNDEDGMAAINISTKYDGDRVFSYIIRNILGSENRMEFILLEGTEVVEKRAFDKENSVDNLIVELKDSNYLIASKADEYSGSGILKQVTQERMNAGTNPETTTQSYSNAFELLEPYIFNTICVDTDDTAAHTLLAAFTERIYMNGTMNFAVVGEPRSVDFETRLKHSKSYNDYNVVYFGHSWKDLNGDVFEGYLGTARIAGLIAAVPSNETITRRSIKGAVEILEPLTNDQIERSIKSGMITLRYNRQGVIVIEKGITTLVSPEGQDDEGWKKVKRCKVRFEAFQRISDTLEKYIGIPNDDDSWALIIQTIRGVLKEMAGERKIFADFDAWLDPLYPPEGDSAWFIIRINDIDSLEQIYLNYHLRFSPNR